MIVRFSNDSQLAELVNKLVQNPDDPSYDFK
jgi:hypothetical protein